jgi:hypothetical protein
MIYVDANVWIFWFDQRLPEHKHVLNDSRIIMLRKVSPKEFVHYVKAFSSEGSTVEEKAIRNCDISGVIFNVCTTA